MRNGLSNERKKEGEKRDKPSNIQVCSNKRPKTNQTPTKLLNIGDLYRHGDEKKGVEQDIHRAIYFYNEAAELENVEAMKNLARIYKKGKHDVEKDNVKSDVWYQRIFNFYNASAYQGDTYAMIYLARKYRKGARGIQQDTVKSISWYEKASEKGNMEALGGLISIYLNDIPHCNIPKAIELLERKIKMKCRESMSDLAKIYRDGMYGVEKNIPKAIEIYEIMIMDRPKDSWEGLQKISMIFKKEPMEPEKIVQTYERMINYGSATKLAVIYRDGLYKVEKNTKKAVELIITDTNHHISQDVIKSLFKQALKENDRESAIVCLLKLGTFGGRAYVSFYKKRIPEFITEIRWEPRLHHLWPSYEPGYTDGVILILLLISKHRNEGKFASLIKGFMNKSITMDIIKYFCQGECEID